MTAALLALFLMQAATPVTRTARDGNAVVVQVAGGEADIEWASTDTFKFRVAKGKLPRRATPLSSGPVKFDLIEQAGDSFWIRTADLGVEINRADFAWRMHDIRRKALLTQWERIGADGSTARELSTNERVYGMGPREDPAMDARGSKLSAANAPLAVSSLGYGVHWPGAGFHFDLTDGFRVQHPEPKLIEFVFYLGPRVKDVYERHLAIVPQKWFLIRDHVRATAKAGKPFYAPILPPVLHQVLQASLAGTLVPAVDCSAQWQPWCVFMPALIAPRDKAGAPRDELEPYLLTYFHEVKDRGYPVLRPLVLQYPSDREAGSAPDQFMLGDELLIAPLPPAANRRPVRLPMGRWTDLRTNLEYAGRQTHDIEGPASNPPVFVKNGSLVPLKKEGYFEAHYFPKLGAEFFIFEPDVNDWTQLHASPAADWMRLETESKVTREYEWIIHHVKAPLEVESKTPVTWKYDERARNLHVRQNATAGLDMIINIRFPE
jgi:alpha-glucosidase (family GH31 glycosyl hydrolase)